MPEPVTPAESWDPRRLLRQLNRARVFGINTCPASRHVQIMARGLLSKGGYPMLQEEPEHCAGSLLATLLSLFTTRSRLLRARIALSALHEVCERMDCERESDRPSEQEYQFAMNKAAAVLREP